MSFSQVAKAPMAGPISFRFRFDYDIAFQAIFDLREGAVWAYEALVRGPNGEAAKDVINAIPGPAMYAADQLSRETAIWLASDLGLEKNLSVNFLRSALLAPEDYVDATLNTAQAHGISPDRIMLEFSEAEDIHDVNACRDVVNRHIDRGFLTAMDDFGAGFQGLSLLCEVRPHVIKLDMALIRGIDKDPRRAKIVSAMVKLCKDLNVMLISEGVETEGELVRLIGLGVTLFQGFYLARPQISALLTTEEIDAALSAGHDATRLAG